MLRKISVRTIPLSRCGAAGGAAELPGAGVVPDTPRSMPLIFFSIEAAVCRQTPLYFGQISAKSDTRDHKPYPTAPPNAVPRGPHHRKEQENYDHRADGAWNPPALQEFHHRIETVREQNREHQRDHHALRVVGEEQNDGPSDYPQAEGRSRQADVFLYLSRFFGRFCC